MTLSYRVNSQADPVDESLRYEIKVPLQRLQYVEFERYMRAGGLLPKEAFPPRRIHSVYLDTPDFDDYLDNVSGVSTRKKARIRWYDRKPEQMALELKRKRNKVSSKQVVTLKNELRILPVDRLSVIRLFAENEKNAETRSLLGTFPTLEVTYKRHYRLLGSDVRMTIDTDMRFRRLYPNPSASSYCSPVDVVVEFKYPVHAERAARASTRWPSLSGF